MQGIVVNLSGDARIEVYHELSGSLIRQGEVSNYYKVGIGMNYIRIIGLNENINYAASIYPKSIVSSSSGFTILVNGKPIRRENVNSKYYKDYVALASKDFTVEYRYVTNSGKPATGITSPATIETTFFDPVWSSISGNRDRSATSTFNLNTGVCTAALRLPQPYGYYYNGNSRWYDEVYISITVDGVIQWNEQVVYLTTQYGEAPFND